MLEIEPTVLCGCFKTGGFSTCSLREAVGARPLTVGFRGAWPPWLHCGTAPASKAFAVDGYVVDMPPSHRHR